MDEDEDAGILMLPTVNILYWSRADRPYTCFQMPCPAFPYFNLTEGTRYEFLEIFEGGRWLIETFDVAQGTWIVQYIDASMPRDVSRIPYLLYRRLCQPWANCPDMKVQVDALMDMERKRQRRDNFGSIDDAATPPSNKRPNLWLLTQPLTKPWTNAAALPNYQQPVVTNADDTTASGAPYAYEVWNHGQGGENSSAVTSSSAEIRWPLTYVVEMANGLDKMSTLEGSTRVRFEKSFRTSFPSNQRAVYETTRVWAAGSKELKEKYIRAGYSDDGWWRSFKREVYAAYPDGKIPLNTKRRKKSEVGVQ